jgi:hypothetical protein
MSPAGARSCGVATRRWCVGRGDGGKQDAGQRGARAGRCGSAFGGGAEGGLQRQSAAAVTAAETGAMWTVAGCRGVLAVVGPSWWPSPVQVFVGAGGSDRRGELRSWKLCDAIGILPFHQRADRRMPIKKCLNMFAVRFFLKADHQKCKLKSWDPIFKKGDPLKSNPAKCYKDDQYRKHACYMCKLRIHSSDAKRPIRAFKYCATCNPEGDTRLAICAECFPNHKKQVEYFNVCPPATLPASGARAS